MQSLAEGELAGPRRAEGSLNSPEPVRCGGVEPQQPFRPPKDPSTVIRRNLSPCPSAVLTETAQSSVQVGVPSNARKPQSQAGAAPIFLPQTQRLSHHASSRRDWRTGKAGAQDIKPP
jgi:hypothetical protein